MNYLFCRFIDVEFLNLRRRSFAEFKDYLINVDELNGGKVCGAKAVGRVHKRAILFLTNCKSYFKVVEQFEAECVQSRYKLI